MAFCKQQQDRTYRATRLQKNNFTEIVQEKTSELIVSSIAPNLLQQSFCYRGKKQIAALNLIFSAYAVSSVQISLIFSATQLFFPYL